MPVTIPAAERRAMTSAQRAFNAASLATVSKSGTARLGPFRIDYKISSTEMRVSAWVDFAGLKTKLFTATLTRSRNSISKTVTAVAAKASLTISADFPKLRLTASAEVCVKKLSRRGFTWSCKKMSMTIG